MPDRKQIIKKMGVYFLKALAIVFAFSLLITLPFSWIDPPTTSFIILAKLSTAKDAPDKIFHTWVDWEEISPNMPIAAVASEDQNFPSHFGFDLESISKVMSKKNRRMRGASTITQQVVKNIYLWPGKSFIRKGIEAYLTLYVESFWSKKRILEVYLNIAEFGKGVYGVEAASQKFFHKKAAKLTMHEAALLAAVLPSPKRMSAGNPSAYVNRRAEWIVRQVKQLDGAEYLKDL